MVIISALAFRVRSLSACGQIWGIGGYSLNKHRPFVRKRALLAKKVSRISDTYSKLRKIKDNSDVIRVIIDAR